MWMACEGQTMAIELLFAPDWSMVEPPSSAKATWQN